MRGAPPVRTWSSSTAEMPTNRYPTTGEQRTQTMPQRSRRPSRVPCPDPFNHHIHSRNSCFLTWGGMDITTCGRRRSKKKIMTKP